MALEISSFLRTRVEVRVQSRRGCSSRQIPRKGPSMMPVPSRNVASIGPAMQSRRMPFCTHYFPILSVILLLGLSAQPAGADVPYAWGYNFYGQVGDGTTTNRA